MISNTDQRGFLLPFLAGALITSPLWYRPCCRYPYSRPYGGGGYYYYGGGGGYGYGNPGYPPYPPYPYPRPGYGGGFVTGGSQGFIAGPQGFAAGSQNFAAGGMRNKDRYIGGKSFSVGFGYKPYPYYPGLRPPYYPRYPYYPYYPPYYPYYCYNSPYCYYHRNPYYQSIY